MFFWIKFLFQFLLVFFCFSAMSLPVSSPNIVFLNPSIPTSSFFQPVTSIMKAAAQDLGVNLEVVYANRDPIALLREGEKIIFRDKKPDYLVLVNDTDKIPQLLEMAEQTNIKTVLFNGALSKANIKKYTTGKEKLKNWIGGILPDDKQAGFSVIKTLVEKAREKNLYAEDGKIHIVGINGNFRSHSPLMREKGLREYISENDDVVLNQVVNAYWSQDKAEVITRNLLTRYPETSVIWSASDQMALGVIKGANELGYRAGKDILSCGIDWLPIAFDDIKNGYLSCSVGGHLFDGAWLMVLLMDHYNNKAPQFLDEKTTFYVMDKASLKKVKKILSHQFWDTFNFKHLSQSYGHTRPNKFGVQLVMEQNFGQP